MNEVRIEKTGQPDVISTSDGWLTLSVPIHIKRRGGRKVVRLPDGNTLNPGPSTTNRRPFKWRWRVVTDGWPCWSPGKRKA
jgi:hypothetical protein